MAPLAPSIAPADEIDALLLPSSPVMPAPTSPAPPRPEVADVAPVPAPMSPVAPADEIDALLVAPPASPAPASPPPAAVEPAPADELLSPTVVAMPASPIETMAPVQPDEGLPGADEPGPPPPGHPQGSWRLLGIAALVVAALVIVFMAFHSAGKGGASPTASRHLPSTTVPATRVTVTSAPPSTTSTTAAPAAPPASPQSTADGAASLLVSSWASGNQAKALSVATAQAVSTLFAAHYQSGLAGDRGCSSGGPPVTCAFGPPGGASPTDPLYSLTVIQAPGGGWYVSAVQILG